LQFSPAGHFGCVSGLAERHHEPSREIDQHSGADLFGSLAVLASGAGIELAEVLILQRRGTAAALAILLSILLGGAFDARGIRRRIERV
jgi:hypothetical protein